MENYVPTVVVLGVAECLLYDAQTDPGGRVAQRPASSIVATTSRGGDPLKDGMIRVTLLGTGSPTPSLERFGPSTLVEAGDSKLLFDCGRGVTQRLLQIDEPFPRIDKLFLTHLHSDHVVGIPDLMLTGWLRARKTPFQVWGPEGTRDMMSHLVDAFQFDIHTRREDERLSREGITVIGTDIQQGVMIEIDGVKVTTFEVEHGPVKPSFGYRIDYAGRSIALSGDTRFSQNLIEHARGVDLLVHEVLAPRAFGAQIAHLSPAQMQRVMDYHVTPEQAGEVFSRVKPKLAVYSHIVPGHEVDQEVIQGTRKTYSGEIAVGEDLMVIDVGEEVEIVRRH